MRALISVFVLSWLLLGASSLHAQDATASEIATARALFHEGTAAAERGDWPAARDAFRRAYALVPELSILFNLAAAQERVGELVEGSESYRRYLRVGEGQADEQLLAQARHALARIMPRLGQIVVRVPGIEPGDLVYMGDAEFADAMLGVSVPANPGTIRVTVRCAEALCGEATLEMQEGGQSEVVVEISRPDPIIPPEELARQVVAPPLENPAAAIVAAEEEAGGVSPWVWAGLSTAVVAAGVVTAVLIMGGDADVRDGTFEGAWRLD